MIEKKELSLVHEILEPEVKTDKPPLLLMLHGYGSHEQDLFSMAHMLNKHFLIVSARAPLGLGWGGFAWYEINFENPGKKMSNIVQANGSLEKLQKFLGEIHDAYNTDKDNTWLMGFSQGAILSYALALKNPAAFKGVLALSGYILKDIVPEKYQPQGFRNLEIFASHGTADEIIPVELARSSVKMLEELKVNHMYREYPMGHGINQDCFQDLRFWLKEKGMV